MNFWYTGVHVTQRTHVEQDMDTPRCTTCGSDEALKHRLAGALKDPTRCAVCQGLAERKQTELQRQEDKRPPLKVTLGDLLMDRMRQQGK